jgi:hypothetical protein
LVRLELPRDREKESNPRRRKKLAEMVARKREADRSFRHDDDFVAAVFGLNAKALLEDLPIGCVKALPRGPR